IRLMVCTQELVCSVPNARWPVSLITSAASMVSRSRISPTRTTSGSWRRMYLSAFLKLCVSAPTSRWFTTQFLCGCRYSIGSSMVTMCSCRSVLILSMIDASVVDLPEPVGPVTSTRPRGFFASSLMMGGSPSSWKVRSWCRLGTEVPLPGGVGGGVAHDLLDRGHARLELGDPRHAQRLHAQPDRLVLQLRGRGAVDHQLLHAVPQRHHFVERDAALVAAVVAGPAAGRLEHFEGADLVGLNADVGERLRRHLDLLLA